eukprot:2327607-Pyramimonas_sp.AAC.1
MSEYVYLVSSLLVPRPLKIEIVIYRLVVLQLVSHQRPRATPIRIKRGGGPMVDAFSAVAI